MASRYPPFRCIEAFVAAAQALSFTEAASSLRITVPAVSRRIQTLETDLGVRLFRRGHRAVTLTPAGESYLKKLLPALGTIREASDSLRATPRRLWPMRLFRTAVAALLLLSLGLLHAADRLNQDSAARSGLGLPHWTAEAQQAADIMGGDPASRQYIAICLVAGNGHSSRSLYSQGVDR